VAGLFNGDGDETDTVVAPSREMATMQNPDGLVDTSSTAVESVCRRR
jgi:hypothetical protein